MFWFYPTGARTDKLSYIYRITADVKVYRCIITNIAVSTIGVLAFIHVYSLYIPVNACFYQQMKVYQPRPLSIYCHQVDENHYYYMKIMYHFTDCSSWLLNYRFIPVK